MRYLPLIMFIHFVADFLCQTRWMAENKGKSLKVLLLHVFVYWGFLFGILVNVITHCGTKETPVEALIGIIWFGIINAVLHFVTDFLTSKLTTYFYTRKNLYGFFSAIGFDQYIHFLCLYYTAEAYL